MEPVFTRPERRCHESVSCARVIRATVGLPSLDPMYPKGAAHVDNHVSLGAGQYGWSVACVHHLIKSWIGRTCGLVLGSGDKLSVRPEFHPAPFLEEASDACISRAHPRRDHCE
ncbi:hypothetical protein GONAM_02_01450 [Gordonia namibiensis NBRC 108229]|uniref:Uncharacterized protein n=1 Tax=Gordonia namibiensis NBRC 108229 TaxID=1208314 RepID=K6X2L5_9ACTN|nr:hypothetical protein GONAM_02_01450 [Gordonia namibiensis NBRC 108229]